MHPNGNKLLRKLGQSPTIIEHGIFWWPFVLVQSLLCTQSLHIRVACFVFGAFVQSFIEYASHAWLFHGCLWGMHKGHHKRPGDDRKLLVPLAFSVIAGVAAYLFTWWLMVVPMRLGMEYSLDLLGGMSAGSAFWYILFEYVHYVSHNPTKMRSLNQFQWFKDLQLMHKQHHYEDDNGNYKVYGFTTTLWDRIFGTL